MEKMVRTKLVVSAIVGIYPGMIRHLNLIRTQFASVFSFSTRSAAIPLEFQSYFFQCVGPNPLPFLDTSRVPSFDWVVTRLTKNQ